MVDGGRNYLLAKWAKAEKNPHEMSVAEQIVRLREINELGATRDSQWIRIPEEVFEQLERTAPVWPRGKQMFRSLRIRFGEGDDGVAQTFEAHCARIRDVFGADKYFRDKDLRSGRGVHHEKPVEYLRLLNGNDTHRACVEWVVIDLSTYHQRTNVASVRGPNSLADELLVFAWMFPDVIREIDLSPHPGPKARPGLIAAGYEVNFPGLGSEWPSSVLIDHKREPEPAHVRILTSDAHGISRIDNVPELRPLLGSESL